MLRVDPVRDRLSWANVARKIRPSRATLAERIALLEAELATLRRQQRAEDSALFLLEVLRVCDDWFTVRELCARLQVCGSPKAIGKRLRQILDDQQRLEPAPTLRLLRHPISGRALWKIESV
jgi:hypothetical protein